MNESLVEAHPDEAQLQEARAMRQLAIETLDSQITTARAFPRVVSRVIDRVQELATVDEETAKACFYARPVGGGKIAEGPGVRLAEIVAASYGNLHVKVGKPEITETHIIIEATCIDLETNYSQTMPASKSIIKSDGGRYSDNQIAVMVLATASIAMRNAVFKVVPMSIFKSVIDRVKELALGKGKTIDELRDACMTVFKDLGVKQAQVLDLVDKKRKEDLTLDDLHVLRGVVTAIREGTATVEEVFAAPKAAAPKAGRERIGKGPSKTAPKGDGDAERGA